MVNSFFIFGRVVEKQNLPRLMDDPSSTEHTRTQDGDDSGRDRISNVRATEILKTSEPASALFARIGGHP
jgi:hypothetical protein